MRVTLTGTPGRRYFSKLSTIRRPGATEFSRGSQDHEAHIQSPESQAPQQAWIPRTHGHEERPEGPQSSSPEGSASPHREGRPEVRPPMAGAGSGDGAGSRHRFPRAARIRRGVEIRELLRRGERTRASHLEVFWAQDPARGPRFGTIVPKHGHTVVERNLVRRRLKEIGRTHVLPELRSCGRTLAVLVRARPSAYGSSFSTLHDELARITEGLCSEPSSSS